MARNIAVVGTLNGYNDAKKTYTWTLSNPTPTTNGNTTTYTYTTSYTVKIDPNGKEADGSPLSENKFYPTNEVTTLYYTDANGDPQKADFPVPGVKVKLGSLEIIKDFEGLPVGTTPDSVSFTVTGPNSYNQTVTMTANDQWTKTLTGLTPGEYTVTENEESAKVEGYVLTAPAAQTATVTLGNTATSFLFTNTYAEESTPPAEDVPVNIPVTKNVTISRGSKEPAETLFTFEASVGDQKFTLPLIPKKAENWTATGMLRVSIPYELFKDGVATVTIKEIPGGDTRWTYDKDFYTVDVFSNGDGISWSGPMLNGEVGPLNEITFKNVYTYKYTPAPRPTTPAKPVTSVQTGDMGVALYAGLAILSMTGSAGVILRRRKNDK